MVATGHCIKGNILILNYVVQLEMNTKKGAFLKEKLPCVLRMELYLSRLELQQFAITFFQAQ